MFKRNATAFVLNTRAFLAKLVAFGSFAEAFFEDATALEGALTETPGVGRIEAHAHLGGFADGGGLRVADKELVALARLFDGLHMALRAPAPFGVFIHNEQVVVVIPAREDACPAGRKQPWPKTLAERARAVEIALHAAPAPVTPAEVAQQFSRAAASAVDEIFQTLITLGRARPVSFMEKKTAAVCRRAATPK